MKKYLLKHKWMALKQLVKCDNFIIMSCKQNGDDIDVDYVFHAEAKDVLGMVNEVVPFFAQVSYMDETLDAAKRILEEAANESH